MADYKISDISAEQTTPVSTDLYEIETAGGTSKKITLSTILTALTSEPTGTIKDWDKTFPGTPSLPSNYVECDGAIISDASSPFNGYRSRNLNNESIAFSVTWASGVATIAATDITALLVGQSVSGGSIAAGAYITDITGYVVTMSDTSYSGTLSTTFTETNGGRYLRGSSSSGVGSLDRFQGHIVYSGVLANSVGAGLTHVYGSDTSETPGSATGNMSGAVGVGTHQPKSSTPKDDGTNGTPRTGLETKVLDMTVVKIMKIK